MTFGKFCPICGGSAQARFVSYCSRGCAHEGKRRLETQNVERAAIEQARQARRARLAAEYARTEALTGEYAQRIGPSLPVSGAAPWAPAERAAAPLETVRAPVVSQGAELTRARLTELRVSYTNAAALCGISESALRNYARSLALPGPGTRVKIERALGVPVGSWDVPASVSVSAEVPA